MTQARRRRDEAQSGGRGVSEEAPEELIESEETPIDEAPRRNALSIALVAGLGALLLICVVLVLIANSHRPAGL